MNNFNYYKFYLKETKSISDSCEKNADIIINVIIPYINSFTKNDKKNFIFNINESDFIVKDLLININLLKYSENVCNAISYLSKSSINNNILENVEIKFNIYIKEINDDFLLKIESIILHELLHIFQHYKISSKNKFRPSYFSIGVIINQLRNKFNSKYVNNILDLLYISIDHEIAANIHQYYYLKNNKVYNMIFDNINKLENFNTKVLSNIETNELNILKQHIYNCIINNISNKNYLKKMNISMWKEDNNILFLILLEEYFHKKSRLIKNKINRINKKLNKPISYNINETINQSFDTNWNQMIDYDPFYFIKLVK